MTVLGKTRIFFVTDVHGSDKAFFKFVNAASIYKAQILIIGGDVAGKSVVPIFSKGETFTAKLEGNLRTAKNKEELERLEKDIRATGSYPYITTESEWSELIRDPTKMDRLFDVLIKESLERWCTIAEERLKKLGVRVIINKGNDDPPIVEQTLKSFPFIEFPDERIIEIDKHHGMLSLGYSNITPWRLPGDLPEEVITSKIEACLNGAYNINNMIFNIHVPPYNTHLDLAPKLDSDLKPVLNPGGEPEIIHVGSTAVREAIEKYQPLLALHGHIHESKGVSKIGRTHCFNPGSEYSIGVLKGLIVDISENKIEAFVFTTG